MIRVCFSYNKAYGYDVTDLETKPSEYYDNLLTEDLVERVSEGDKLMYFGDTGEAEEWCMEHSFEFELIIDDNN